MPPGIGGGMGMSMGSGGVNQQQHPLFRGYSPSKPKWKGSQPGIGAGGSNMLVGNPGSTGFSYNPSSGGNGGGTNMGVMMASGFPINTSSGQGSRPGGPNSSGHIGGS